MLAIKSRKLMCDVQLLPSRFSDNSYYTYTVIVVLRSNSPLPCEPRGSAQSRNSVMSSSRIQIFLSPLFLFISGNQYSRFLPSLCPRMKSVSPVSPARKVAAAICGNSDNEILEVVHLGQLNPARNKLQNYFNEIVQMIPHLRNGGIK